MKYKLRIEAIKLRKKGLSYNEILKHIPVSKGTLSLWLRDIPLSSAQKKKLYTDTRQKNARRLANLMRQRKQDQIKVIASKAKVEVQELKKDVFFVAGVMLYWAEGDKSEETEQVKFTNSDHNMIKFMMRWFRKYCSIGEDKFKIQIHIHELQNKEKIIKHWISTTKLPRSQFHKTQIKQTTLGHRKNKLYNGTCSIRISSRALFRKIKYWRIHLLESLTI